MADRKISQLTAVTTPLDGAEELPIVQSGVTKKVSAANLTAGRPVSVSDFTYTGTLTGGTGVVNIGSGQFQKDVAGNVGIGGDTTGVIAGFTVTSKFCVKSEGSSPVAGFVQVNDTTASTGSGTFACRSRGTTASPAIVQNNDALWNMFVAGHDGTDLALAAQISVEVDGTPGSDDMPGRIRLLTTPDGTQTPVEAMRIDSAQKVTFANDVEVGGSFSITGTFVSAGGYAAGAGALVTEAGTSRTLTAADNGKVIYCTNGAAVTISCPDGLDVGFNATIIQAGAGKVTLAASGTATLNSYSGLLSTMGQFAVISVVSPVADEFIAAGNLGV